MARLSKLGFIDARHTRSPVRRRLPSRGVPVALRDREILCTDHLADAAGVVSGLLGRCSLRPEPSAAAPFQTTLNAVRIRDVTMAYLDFHAPTTVDVRRTGAHYTVHMPTSGLAAATYRGRQIEVSPYHVLVVSPGEELRMRVEHDSPQVILRIEEEAVDRTLTRMLGRAPGSRVVFDPVLDLTAEAAVRWHTVMQLLSTELVTPGSLLHAGSGVGQIEDFVISTLLLIQGSNHTIGAVPGRSARRTVQRAVAHIEAHLAAPVTMTHLAEATGMSVRAIQQGFQEDLGTTPMAYVRDC
ncbi:MAG: AraC family transcriptional regulator [Tetrasphaera sp.]|nr:AraC family transcriptional regulator [Tetrasphaera sp.]